MQREALVIYLQNLRDLEVAKWKIDRIYDEKQQFYEKNEAY